MADAEVGSGGCNANAAVDRAYLAPVRHVLERVLPAGVPLLEKVEDLRGISMEHDLANAVELRGLLLVAIHIPALLQKVLANMAVSVELRSGLRGRAGEIDERSRVIVG
jgi:hypothetical protein